MEHRIVFEPPRPAFDVLVVAGDVSDLITRSIRMVSALAAGKPAVFVAGNHEWRRDERSREEKLTAAHASAAKHGVHFLECDAVDIAGVRFAGAMLGPQTVLGDPQKGHRGAPAGSGDVRLRLPSPQVRKGRRGLEVGRLLRPGAGQSPARKRRALFRDVGRLTVSPGLFLRKYQ
jgi:hypothetical protein